MVPEPLYKKIAKYLKEEIKKKYSPGDKIPSEYQVSKMFKVSRMTARKAMEILANEGLIVRIPGMGSYVSDILPKNHIVNIGVIINGALDLRAQAMLSEIMRVLQEFSANSILVTIEGYSPSTEEKLEHLKDLNISGLIITPTVGIEESPTLKYFIDTIPVVSIDRYIEGIENVPVVESNNKMGGKLLGEYLREKCGTKKALFVTEESLSVSSVKGRYEGFKEGFKGDVEILFVKDANDIYQKLSKKIQEESYDSIFFCHDLLALAGTFTVIYNGYRVPEDIKIVGFDDRMFSRYIIPSLTTVRQDFSQIGKTAAWLLIEMLRGKPAPKKVSIPVELVVRESTNCD